MTKIYPKKMFFPTKKPLKNLCEKMQQLESKADFENFFCAFFTPAERKTLEDRVQIVEQLLEGHSQREIAKSLGVSVSQVSRGSAELQFGAGKDFFPSFFEKNSWQK